jgi:hypothetical protein
MATPIEHRATIVSEHLKKAEEITRKQYQLAKSIAEEYDLGPSLIGTVMTTLALNFATLSRARP